MARNRPWLAGTILALVAGAAGALLVRLSLLEGGPEHGDHEGHQRGGAAGTGAGGGRDEAASADVLYRVGNAVCPGMGGDTVPDQLVVLEGLGIGICCPACEDDIRAKPVETVRKLLDQETSGPRLAAWLDAHPEVRARLGLGTGGRSEETAVPARPPAPGRRLTALENPACPVDGDPVRDAAVAEVDGLRVALCSPSCQEAFEKDPASFLERLERDPGLRKRIEAHHDLVRRGGHGPHWHCATCDVRSAAPGPCPECGGPLARPEDEPAYALGNARCPIMDEAIENGTVVTYRGLAIRICCPSCEETFRQYPGYYLAKLEREQGIPVPRIVEEAR